MPNTSTFSAPASLQAINHWPAGSTVKSRGVSIMSCSNATACGWALASIENRPMLFSVRLDA